MKSPSQAQIDYADNIAKTLNIDFPTCSADFTAYNYWQFINSHIVEYNAIINQNIYDEDTLYFLCDNDIWCEFY